MKRIIKYKKTIIVVFTLTIFFIFYMTHALKIKWEKHIPSELGPAKVIYLVDGTHLVGPSGIRDAFIVYEFNNKKIIQKLLEEGITFLENMPSTQKYKDLENQYKKVIGKKNLDRKQKRKLPLQHWKNVVGMYEDWKKTPMDEKEERWNKTRNRHYKRLMKGFLTLEQRWDTYNNIHSKFKEECTDISVCSFFGDLTSIPSNIKNSENLKHLSLEDLNFYDEIKNEYVELVEKIIKSPNSFFGYGEYGVLIISPEHKKMFMLFRH